MPRFDGTGPDGRGPFGRGLGPCGEGEYSARRNYFGFGRGRRSGWASVGRGYPRFAGRFFADPQDLEAEKTWLERRLEVLNQLIDKNHQE